MAKDTIYLSHYIVSYMQNISIYSKTWEMFYFIFSRGVFKILPNIYTKTELSAKIVHRF